MTNPDVIRSEWTALAAAVLAGKRDGLRCPVCGNETLDVEWLPHPGGDSGEFHLECRTCGAENFVLKRTDPPSGEGD